LLLRRQMHPCVPGGGNHRALLTDYTFTKYTPSTR
jgi:hypothetical protein